MFYCFLSPIPIEPDFFTQLKRSLEPIELADKAAHYLTSPPTADYVQVRCWDKAEADAVKFAFANRHPQIDQGRLIVSWKDFGETVHNEAQ